MTNKKAYEELEITFVTMPEQSVLAVSLNDNDGDWIWGDGTL